MDKNWTPDCTQQQHDKAWDDFISSKLELIKEKEAAGIKEEFQNIPLAQAIAICRYNGYTVAKH